MRCGGECAEQTAVLAAKVCDCLTQAETRGWGCQVKRLQKESVKESVKGGGRPSFTRFPANTVHL